MSYRPLIIKSEVESYVKIGANVSKNEAIESAIKDMQEFEFKPIVALTFYNALITTPGIELQLFLETYIKPYLILGAYEKFLLWHGRNVSQYGLRENNEDTSTPISDKARGELMADIRNKANIRLLEMDKQLNLVNYTFDGITYDFTLVNTSKAKPSIGMRQVGKIKVDTRNHYPFNNRFYYGN